MSGAAYSPIYHFWFSHWSRILSVQGENFWQDMKFSTVKHRTRRSFSRIKKEVLDLPNLIEIQNGLFQTFRLWFERSL